MGIFDIFGGSKRQIDDLQSDISRLENELRYVTSQNIPLSDYKPSFLGQNVVGKIEISEASALTLSTVWACVKLKSKTIAALPRNYYVRGLDGNSTIATDHPAHKLLKQPNPFMSGFDFWFAISAARMLHGNGYAIIIRDGNGTPIELTPIHPQRIEVKVVDGKVFYEIDGNDKNPISPDNMLHFKGLSLDGIVGLSTIKTEAQNLGLAIAPKNELSKFYAKGSRIDGFVSYPNKFDGAAKSKTEKALEDKAESGESSRRPILDNGAKYIPVGVNPAEALWLEMMGYSVEDIARIFEVPPHLIGHLKQSTNNNIEHQGMDFVNYSLLPDVKCYEEELDRKLTNPFDKGSPYSKFNMNGLLRGDSQARAALYNSLFQNGGITPNQICQLEDLPTFEGGDVHMVQLNMIDVSKSSEYYSAKQTVQTRDLSIDELLDLISKKQNE